MNLKTKPIQILIFILALFSLTDASYCLENDDTNSDNGYIVTYFGNTSANSTQNNSYNRSLSTAPQYLDKFNRVRLINAPTTKNRSAYNSYCKNLIKKHSNIVGCMPNTPISLRNLPNDQFITNCSGSECSCPLFDEDSRILADSEESCQWALWGEGANGMDIVRAWETTTGSSDYIVAVIDSGVDYNHPDIAPNMWTNPGEIANNGIDDDNNGYIDDVFGINTTDDGNASGDPMDFNGHGTHVAGIIGAKANNTIGISGVAQEVKIMAVKILDQDGNGRVASAIEALNYVADMAVTYNQNIIVMNNSWGGAINPNLVFGENGLSAAFINVDAAEILSTTAAGNNGINNDTANNEQFPANLDVPNNISVASSNVYGEISDFSNYGGNKVHIAAPGESVRSLYLEGSNFNSGKGVEAQTILGSGTSMAAPNVAGLLVLIKSAFPELSYLETKDKLLNRVVPLRNNFERARVLSGGIANAYYALNEEEIPVPTPTATPEPTPTPEPTAEPSPTPEPTATPSPTPTAIPSISPSPTSTPTLSTEPTPKQEIETPTATPSEELVVQEELSYLTTIRARLSRKKRRFRTDKVLPRKIVEIQISTIGLTTTSEELFVSLEINGKSCELSSKEFTTDKSGNTILEGRVKKLTRSTKTVRVILKDKKGSLKGSASARVIHNKRSAKKKFKLQSACKRISFS